MPCVGRNALAAVAAVVLLAGTWVCAAQAGATFGAETFTLDNGMQVVVIPNHRVPVVYHSVWYKVGAADEPAGKSGIAHMLEHLMGKGTDKIAPGAFTKIIARNGGSANAFTSHDHTGYYQYIARDRLEMVMEMEADRMVNLVFNEQDFLTEREVVLEERRGRTDNNPRALFSEQVNAVQYLSHPYGRPVVGWEHEIRSNSYDDAYAFYRAHYVPNNVILIVAGDITVAELRPLAERIYGAIPAKPVPARARPREPLQRAARRLEMVDPRVGNPEWRRSYLAPSFRVDPDRHAVSLEVLAEILGGGATSRLYQVLVVEQQLASNARVFYDGGFYDLTQFAIHVQLRPGIDMKQVEAAVEAEIERLVSEGITYEELARAKFGMKAEAIYARDNSSSLAQIFGDALSAGQTVDDVESWTEDVEAITADRVVAAAKAVLRPEKSVTGLLLPDAADDGEDQG